MDTNSQQNDRELELRHLQIFEVLLHERSLTKAARVLDLTQPALSKTLARLRLYFDDPLFVRVAMRMEPTAKALELAAPVRGIFERMRALRTDHAAFDPRTSDRKFKVFMTDAAQVKLLPALLNLLCKEAPRIQVQAINCDLQHLDLWLESGLVDLAAGSFPSLLHGIRRQFLWRECYAAVARKDHPRLRGTASLEAFINEKHALVSAVGTGHEHLAAEHTLQALIPAENIICTLPTFVSAAHIAKHSDVIVTLPRGFLAESVVADLDLQFIVVPIELPQIEIAQYWHERFHRDPGHQWFRSVLRNLFLRDRHMPAIEA